MGYDLTKKISLLPFGAKPSFSKLGPVFALKVGAGLVILAWLAVVKPSEL